MSNTVKEARVWASSFLEKQNREPRVAELMLQHLLDVDLSEFLLKQQEELSDDVWLMYESWVMEHARTGKPLEHFTERATFYGREFWVNRDVLIPRPETEELIVAIMPHLHAGDVVVDIGTGSGIIALTIKKEMPSVRMLATDLSERALAVAKENSEQLDAEAEFFEGNFLEPIRETGEVPDVIISNPPYIPEKERSELDATVLYDPEAALFAEENGLAAYREIVEQVMQLRRLPRLVAFEIGYDQGESVPQLIKSNCPDAHVEVLQDINGKDRIVLWKN
ncbi:peptide chain release factor N(5)-glutamine methyltransferase [Tenuibacillus multivorans]|uniref:peptide chain release factor N(5)-glutamine methyltransferase n=1 Tax=Tenuibacillus multivorans TaxID=237069 RepID=UPI000A934E19|nr:peptide chain release factor N(5)-glutamine methyltransferase [Tenuibacillus multivorans]GEL77267.1 release factor glutamine methyltransferase [Tenuibacillus multivorans]